MKNKIILSSVLVLALFAVLAISTASALDSEYYLVPDDSGVEGYGNTVQVQLRLNATEAIQTGKVSLLYDQPCAYIALTGFTHGPEWEMKTRSMFPGRYVITFGNEDEYGIPYDLPAGNYLIGTYTIQCNSTTPCVTDLIFQTIEWKTDLASLYVTHVPFTTDNGTFACISPPETFSKYLVEGWNLISLPLTNATDKTVGNIIDTSLNGNYDYLYRYNASAHDFVPLSSSDTMENGVGYFIHMTTADTWTYTGSAYIDMSVGLSTGLNMVGWLNCSKAITGNLTSIDGNYYYAAGWNATSQSYETYNPAAPDPDNPDGFNNLFEMERGTGYFISAKTATTLNEGC